MKIQKPDIPEFLQQTADFKPMFAEMRLNETDIDNRRLINIVSEAEEWGGCNFHRVIFENCRILNADMRKSVFMDVIFKNCDFSNCNFSGAYLKAVEILGCKCLGVDFSESSIREALIADSNFTYADFDDTFFNSVFLKNSDFSSSAFTHCKLKNLALENSVFDSVSFFKTALRGIDFSKSHLGRLNVSDDYKELSGIIVNTAQAAGIAGLLGVVVCD